MIIDLSTNTWESPNRQTSLIRQSRRDQPKPKHKSKKRRRYRSFSSSSCSNSSSLSSHKISKKPKRSRHLHKKRRRRSESSPSSSSLQSMKDYGRYERRRQSLQVVDVQSTVQPVRTIDETPNIHSDNVMRCNQCQKIQALNLKQAPDPLTKQWSLDCYHRSCVRNTRKNTLLLNHYQESNN